MQPDLEDVKVINNETEDLFEAFVDGQHALMAYRRSSGTISLDHTEVPEPLEGKGLAAKLTRTALEFARANHLRVVPLCPYVSSYIRKHPEVQDLVSPDDLQRLLSPVDGDSNHASSS